MSQKIAYGSHEPDPLQAIVVDTNRYREVDKGYALRMHLGAMLDYNNVIGVVYPEVSDSIGSVLASRESILSLHVVQQN